MYLIYIFYNYNEFNNYYYNNINIFTTVKLQANAFLKCVCL